MLIFFLYEHIPVFTNRLLIIKNYVIICPQSVRYWVPRILFLRYIDPMLVTLILLPWLHLLCELICVSYHFQLFSIICSNPCFFTYVVNMYKFPSCFLASLVDHVLICSLFSCFAWIYLGFLNGLFPFAFLNGPKRPTSLNYAQEKVQKPIVWRIDTRRREERKQIKVLH